MTAGLRGREGTLLALDFEPTDRGPARGYPFAQPCDEFDLAPFLRPGTNWIAARVYQFGPGAGAFGLCDKGNGAYVPTGKTGLLMEGDVRFAHAPALRFLPMQPGRRAAPTGIFRWGHPTCMAASGYRNSRMPAASLRSGLARCGGNRRAGRRAVDQV